VNRKGHVETLVAAHPENRNALKNGVFSPRALATRAEELDIAIAARPAPEVVADVLRREVAALAALGEAMDSSFDVQGIRGRGGQPRNLVALRLRLNEKLRRTLEHFQRVHEESGAAALGGSARTESGAGSIAATLAHLHRRASIPKIEPHEVEAELVLEAILTTEDPRVAAPDRLRARKLLTRRQRERASNCICPQALSARDSLELREWIEELRMTTERDPDDRVLAALVRQVRSGERLQPAAAYRRTVEAVDAVVVDAQQPHAQQNRLPAAIKPAVQPLWRVLLSPNERLDPKERLDALVALDEAGELPRCECKPRKKLNLIEDRVDVTRARVVRLVAQKHDRAARTIARFPETYCAVRDAIDDAIVKHATAPAVPNPAGEAQTISA
jgi:hypothetical protein